MKNIIDQKQLLGLEEINQLKTKYLAEPYSIHAPIYRNHNRAKVEIVKWNEDKPNVLASITLDKITEQLWEVDEAVVLSQENKGIGKLLYYVAMSRVYPAYLTHDSEGFKADAKRIYDAFEQLDYVESRELFTEWQGVDMCKDEFIIINRMYRFRFPS